MHTTTLLMPCLTYDLLPLCTFALAMLDEREGELRSFSYMCLLRAPLPCLQASMMQQQNLHHHRNLRSAQVGTTQPEL
jgi:hypothetical protein